jgi:hypothetical protein
VFAGLERHLDTFAPTQEAISWETAMVQELDMARSELFGALTERREMHDL